MLSTIVANADEVSVSSKDTADDSSVAHHAGPFPSDEDEEDFLETGVSSVEPSNEVTHDFESTAVRNL